MALRVARSKETCARRRTTRNSMSLLTGTIRRVAKLAAGRTPNARPG